MHKHEKPHFLCITYFVFLTHPQAFFLFFKIVSFGNNFFPDFFLLFCKNVHDTTRVYVQNSQIRIPLLQPHFSLKKVAEHQGGWTSPHPLTRDIIHVLFIIKNYYLFININYFHYIFFLSIFGFYVSLNLYLLMNLLYI